MRDVLWLTGLQATLWLSCCAAASGQESLPDVFGSAPESSAVQELPDVFGALPETCKPMVKPVEPAKPDPRDAQIDRLLGMLEQLAKPVESLPVEPKRDADFEALQTMIREQSARLDKLAESLEKSSKPSKAATAKPVVWFYSIGKTCVPCVDGERALEKAGAFDPQSDFPFLVIKAAPPAWVKNVPYLHWRGKNGKVCTIEGWPGLQQVLREFEESQRDAVATPPQAPATMQPARPATPTWEKIANSPGRQWGEGPRGQFPTTREHLRDEHGVPMEATRGMNQRQLDRIHGFKHDGAANDSRDARIRRRAYELCAAEYRSKKVSACVPGGGLPGRSQAKSNVSRELSGSVPACC